MPVVTADQLAWLCVRVCGQCVPLPAVDFDSSTWAEAEEEQETEAEADARVPRALHCWPTACANGFGDEPQIEP